MINRVGTSSGSLASATGGVVDDLNNQLLGTDTSGAEAQTLGPQLAREVTTGFPNADFSLIPPEGLDSQISDDNALPFFTAYSAGAAVNNTIEAAISTSLVDEGGYDLRLTAPEGTDNESEFYFERWIPIPGDYAGTYYSYPSIHAYCYAPGDNAPYVYLDLTVEWYDANLTLIDQYLDYWSLDELAGSNTADIYGRTIFSPDPSFNYTAIPENAKWVKYIFGMTVNPGPGQLGSTEELRITGLRMARGVMAPQLILDTDPAEFKTSYGFINVSASNTSLSNKRGTRPTETAGDLTASLTIDGFVSDPTENSYLTHTNLAPHGAKYTGPVTAAASGTQTQLDLTNAPGAGAGMANAASDAIPLYPGVYLVVADISFESDGNGTYRRIFIRNFGTNIGAAVTGVNGAALAYRLSATALVNILPDNMDVANSGSISVAAQQNSGATLDVTLHSLTLVRLGDCW